MVEVRLISDIKVGRRHRQKLDLEPLVASIKHLGLITAITIRPDGQLLAGFRRLTAMQAIGATKIDCRVVDTLDDALTELSIERDANTCRLAMMPSELASLVDEIWPLESKAAKERQRDHGARPGKRATPIDDKRSSSSVEFHGTARSTRGDTRDRVGVAIGVSGHLVGDAYTPYRIANDPDRPDAERTIARAALAEMDETGRVYSVAKEMRRQLRQAREQAATAAAGGNSAAKARQAKARVLNRFAEHVSGLPAAVTTVLERIGDISGLTENERRRWTTELRAGRTALSKLINVLEKDL